MKRVIIAALALLAAQTSLAQPVVHLFGGWQYGLTDGNRYLGGTKEGGYRNANLALNLAAAPSQNLRIEGQLFTGINGAEKETAIDYAFGEWRFSDALRLRVGRVKHPFGIYTEVFDVGTLRPFLSLPQSVYGPVGTLAEAYSGAGISGVRHFRSWSIRYDAYAGTLALPYNDFDDGIAFGPPQDLKVRNVIGGRAVFETAVEGLSFGASVYSGRIEAENARHARHSAAGMQIEYVTDRLSLRGELTKNRTADMGDEAGYAEAAFRITPRWQLAVRRDVLHECASMSDLSGHHHETAAGINYWFSPHFVLKLSGHHVYGNHLAAPDGDDAQRPRTNLLLVGAQFSF